MHDIADPWSLVFPFRVPSYQICLYPYSGCMISELTFDGRAAFDGNVQRRRKGYIILPFPLCLDTFWFVIWLRSNLREYMKWQTSCMNLNVNKTLKTIIHVCNYDSDTKNWN